MEPEPDEGGGRVKERGGGGGKAYGRNVCEVGR